MANVESQNLSVINVANYSVEETIPYGATLDYGASDLPGSAAYDPTSEQVYVVGELTGDVLAYDVLNYSLAAVIPVGTNPTSISFDSVDGDLYVANAGSSNLSVISGRHDNITATISLPSGLTSSPEEVACDGRGDVYVSNSDGNMTIVNDTNNTVAATEQLPGYSGGVPTFGFGYDPLDHIEYATDTTSDALFAFNGTRFMGMTNLSASQTSMVTPVGLAFDGLDRTLYVSMFNGSVLGLNATTLSQTDVADVNGAPRGLADDSSDGRLYVAGSGYPGDDVAVLATSALNLSKFAFGPSVIRIQHSTNESLLVAGGLTPYRYTYSNLPPGCSSVNVTNLICTPTESGTFETNLTVSDWAGNAVVASATLTILPVQSFPITFEETGLAIGTEWNVGLDGVRESGVASQIQFNEPNGTDLSYSVSPVRAYRLSLEGGSLNVSGQPVNITIRFTAIPSVTIASLVVDPMHVEVGEAVSITVTLVGGLAPFTIQWTGLPPSCPAENISSFQCVPDDAGNWTVGVWVEDSLYTTVHSTATLTAYSPAGNGSHSPGDGSTPPGGSHSGLPLIDYALLGLAVALIVGLTAVVLLRRRPPIDSA